MARNGSGAKGAAITLARPAIVAAAVIALILIWVFGVVDRDPPGSVMPEDVGERPAGAGSLPDGPVDERLEGLGNETSTEDFIDNSAASDNRPAILDIPRGPDPAPGIDALDVPERIDESVVQPGPPPAD